MNFPILIVFLIGFPFLLRGQNLVPNGSFEEYAVCPGSYSRLAGEFRLPFWTTINTGSPDYFNTCSNGDADVPYNWAGVSEAFDGNGYVGIYTWMSLAKEYREYLHCKLVQPLIKDSTYHVAFRYKLSSYSKFCTDRIGILISDSIASVPNDLPLKVPPTFSFIKDSALTMETGMWETASADYKASGNERFITIGNFADNESTHYYYIQFRPVQEPMLASSAYYYIDDVQVIPAYSTPKPMEEVPFAEGEPEMNKVYVLKDIRFRFNSYALMAVSYSALDKVVQYMDSHPEVFVRLSGHTDDVGGEGYNLELSSRRAESAAAYLVSQGIAAERITAAGFGETEPVISGTTPLARDTNRRVEIEFFR